MTQGTKNERILVVKTNSNDTYNVNVLKMWSMWFFGCMMCLLNKIEKDKWIIQIIRQNHDSHILYS